MNLLVLNKKVPFPIRDGESFAMDRLLSSFKGNKISIDLLTMSTEKHEYQLKTKCPEYYNHVRIIPIENKINAKDALVNMLLNRSYNIARFTSIEFNRALKEQLLQYKYDIVQLESLYMVPYISTIKANSKAKIVMRSHNLEYEIWEDLAKNPETPFLKRLYLNYLSKMLKKYEIDHLNDADLFVAISDADLDKFINLGLKIKSLAIPVGVYPHENINNNSENDLSFIGSLDWQANIEGLKWFLEKVLPLIIAERPDTKIHIAGRNASSDLVEYFSKNKHVCFHGEVENSKLFITQFSVMIAPLFSGSGIRVKILEAFSLKRALVSTSKGIEGIPVENGKQAFYTESKDKFAHYCLTLLSDDSVRNEISQRAFHLVNTSFSAPILSERLYEEYDKLIG